MEGGWQDYKPTPRDAGRVMVVGGYQVERSKIPSYFAAESMGKLELFWRYKRLGWPFAGGWAEQPAYLVDIIELLEIEMGKRTNGRQG